LVAVLQRVREASVSVGGREVSRIGRGLLVLLGVARGDGEPQAAELARKCIQLRIFEDEDGKMNKSLLESGGELLAVSQFTLCADTRKGRRPSFSFAAPPEDAFRLYRAFMDFVRASGVGVRGGEFGAKMQVALVNDGPVTFVLEVSA